MFQKYILFKTNLVLLMYLAVLFEEKNTFLTRTVYIMKGKIITILYGYLLATFIVVWFASPAASCDSVER